MLVGNYKSGQPDWIDANGLYSYPVRDGDEMPGKVCRKIDELWSYADVKATRRVYMVECAGKMTRAEFTAANSTDFHETETE